MIVRLCTIGWCLYWDFWSAHAAAAVSGYVPSVPADGRLLALHKKQPPCPCYPVIALGPGPVALSTHYESPLSATAELVPGTYQLGVGYRRKKRFRSDAGLTKTISVNQPDTYRIGWVPDISRIRWDRWKLRCRYDKRYSRRKYGNTAHTTAEGLTFAKTAVPSSTCLYMYTYKVYYGLCCEIAPLL